MIRITIVIRKLNKINYDFTQVHINTSENREIFKGTCIVIWLKKNVIFVIIKFYYELNFYFIY